MTSSAKSPATFRLAQDTDLPAIINIWRENISKEYRIDADSLQTCLETLAELFQARNGYCNFWVALTGETDEVIGWNSFVSILPTALKRNTAVEISTYIKPDYQSNGVAFELMAYCLAELTDSHIAFVYGFANGSKLKIHKILNRLQLFAKTAFAVELLDIDQQETNQLLSREDLIETVNHWKRPLTIVGACTGTDAHTIGLDAILNKKGYKGDKGLESYPCFKVVNLGSQVRNRELIDAIKQNQADVILISQIITHQNVHLHNLTELIDMLEAAGLRSDLLSLIGGPRITHQLALELGFDAGFGIGTKPIDVANYIVERSANLL